MTCNRLLSARSLGGSALIVVTVIASLLAAPTVAAQNGTGPDDGAVPTSGCPDDLSPADTQDAFRRAGAASPDAATQTEVVCSGGVVLTATTADPLAAGETTLVFFTLHDAGTGEVIDAPFMQVNLSGAAAKGGDVVSEVGASVNGTDGLHAVAVSPGGTGQATLTVELPLQLTTHEVSFDATEGADGRTQETFGANVPGFESAAVVGGLVAVALILRRRPPKLLAVALAAAMVAGPGLADPGHGAGHPGETVDVQFAPNPSGLSISTDGLTVTVESSADQPTTSFDLGDFTTAAGPTAEHTYAEPGAYLVQLVAYDPATLTGDIYDTLVQVGDNSGGNKAPSPDVSASTKWTTYGENVTLSAGDAVADVDADNHAYVWTVGRAPVNGSDFVFTLEAVTDEPEWTWTAPSADADVVFKVFAVDSRRAATNASTKVRVTEDLPAEEATFGPFEGELVCPTEIGDEDATGQCDSRHTYTFETLYPGDIAAELTFTTANGQEPEGGVPDVDFRLDDKSSTGTGSPDSLEYDDAAAREHTLEVWLQSGVDASYSVTVDVQYRLDPFA